MDKYIIMGSLTVAVLSLGMVVLTCLRNRRLKREYDRNLIGQLREQDKIRREMEHVRIEKETLEKMLKPKVSAKQ